MPRAIWSGAISFGLVNVPVKLFSAASSKDVRFNQLHAEDNSRIQMKRFCLAENTEVQLDELVKGYEVGPDRYVTLTEDELANLDPEGSRTIDIEEFVDLEDIDPVFFEKSYYLSPEKGGAKAYSLLMQAMTEANKVALGTVVLRSKQYLVALRPAGNALSMATLYYADEVVSQDSLDGLPGEKVEASDREVAMARQLIETLSTEFDPSKYRDEYRERVLDLIEKKAAGEVVEAPEPKEEAPKVVDLMAALEASIANARKASSNGKAEAEKPARKKAAAS